MATGRSIMVEAVLEIHIDRNAVATIKPNTMRDGLVPMARIMNRAIRL